MSRQRFIQFVGAVGAFVVTSMISPAGAQTVTPFQLVGHIQSFSLDTPGDTFSAAKLTVNGIQVTIPRNLVIQLPAAYFTV